MNERLRKMRRFGIMKCTVFGDKPPLEVEYYLTPFGQCVMGILHDVCRLQQAVDQGVVSDLVSLEQKRRATEE